MTVCDASAYVDAWVVVGASGATARAALRNVTALEVPAIFTAEGVSALRSLVKSGELDPIRGAAALGEIRAVRRVEYPFGPFAERVWELRDTLTVYDAWYVALAEELGSELVTADERLARAPGPRCPVVPVREA